MTTLSDMELKVLRACAGEVVQLPYNAEQSRATESLTARGLVYRTMEDDQPTAYATEYGKAVLRDMKTAEKEAGNG